METDSRAERGKVETAWIRTQKNDMRHPGIDEMNRKRLSSIEVKGNVQFEFFRGGQLDFDLFAFRIDFGPDRTGIGAQDVSGGSKTQFKGQSRGTARPIAAHFASGSVGVEEVPAIIQGGVVS